MNKNIQSIYPLSPLQEGILFHMIETPETDMYFQQFSCVIDDLSNAQKWQQSWQELSTRHGIMRTLFTWENRAQPLQIVRKQVELPWLNLDWSLQSASQQANEWSSYLQRDRDHKFDLSKAPLMRFTLVHLGEKRYYFLFSFHHILLDGWSQRLLFDSATEIYRNENIESFSAIPKSESSTYGDFIEYLKTRDTKKSQEFWRHELKGFEQTTSIANDTQKQAESKDSEHQIQNSIKAPQVIKKPLPDALCESLKQQAKLHKLTLNTLILGAWSLVLASHNNTQDVLFGATVAGRPVDLPNAQSIAGLFINTLPLRVTLDGQMILSNWLKNMQSKQAACREFEYASLADIQRVSELGPGRSLFESIVVVENLPSNYAKEYASGEAKDSQTDSKTKALKFDDWQYNEYGNYPVALLLDLAKGIEVIFIYQESKLSSSRAQDVLEQFTSVLSYMSHSLDNTIASVNTLPEKQELKYRQLLQNTNADELEFCPVHTLFEKNVFDSPNASAIVDATGEYSNSVSYKTVNESANRLAHFLIEQGIGKENIVPILLDKSVNALVSFLGVLKSGAAYVVIDVNLPASRIKLLLERLNQTNLLIISEQKFVNNLTRSIDQSYFLFDTEHDKLADYSSQNPAVNIAPNQLAYVIFTSGSSGLPKGVMVEHSALFNSTIARHQYYQAKPERFLLMSPMSTDSSIAGIYWTLTSTSSLLLPKPKIEQDISELADLIQHHMISHILCIPRLYSLLLESVDASLLQSLKTVIVAGEACSYSVLQCHQKSLAKVALFNEYGPSECCVWVSVACLHQLGHAKNKDACEEHSKDDPQASSLSRTQGISIGRAIANTQLYVLDKQHNQVLSHVPGEVYVAGANLARGYLQDEDKTMQAFIDNPFYKTELDNNELDNKKLNSQKLYKTGDLAKFTANGDLIYLGRADNQLKVRGHRVEPEEIEQVLKLHPNIDEALLVLEAPSEQVKSLDNKLIMALSQLPEHESENILANIESAQVQDNKEHV